MSAQRLVLVSEEELRALVRESVQSEMRLTASSPAPTGEVLTRDQTAKLLQVHPKVVSRYVAGRGLRGKKIGRDWRFLRADVLRWMSENGSNGSNGDGH